MNEINLPKLRKIRTDRPSKKKILLLADDIRLHSGIATMAREFVIGTAHHYDWVQLGAAMQHPDHGHKFDMSDEINDRLGIDHASVVVYAHTGYGNPSVLREIMHAENPDAIVFFTDPRFWGWLFNMEHEIRQKVPLIYYNIWDDCPAPHWNFPYYASCDMLLNISRQTNVLVDTVLRYGDEEVVDLT